MMLLDYIHGKHNEENVLENTGFGLLIHRPHAEILSKAVCHVAIFPSSLLRIFQNILFFLVRKIIIADMQMTENEGEINLNVHIRLSKYRSK